MKKNIESHFLAELQGGSDVMALIGELIVLAEAQPEGAIITTTHNGVAIYARAVDTPDSVYAQYQAACSQGMRPRRP